MSIEGLLVPDPLADEEPAREPHPRHRLADVGGKVVVDPDDPRARAAHRVVADPPRLGVGHLAQPGAHPLEGRVVAPHPGPLRGFEREGHPPRHRRVVVADGGNVVAPDPVGVARLQDQVHCPLRAGSLALSRVRLEGEGLTQRVGRDRVSVQERMADVVTDQARLRVLLCAQPLEAPGDRVLVGASLGRVPVAHEREEGHAGHPDVLDRIPVALRGELLLALGRVAVRVPATPGVLALSQVREPGGDGGRRLAPPRVGEGFGLRVAEPQVGDEAVPGGALRQ